jgi:hypothetical protein
MAAPRSQVIIIIRSNIWPQTGRSIHVAARIWRFHGPPSHLAREIIGHVLEGSSRGRWYFGIIKLRQRLHLPWAHRLQYL